MRKWEQTTNQTPVDSKHGGRHAFCMRNSCGQWLRHWAVQHQLTLANAVFQKARPQQSNLPLNESTASNSTTYS